MSLEICVSHKPLVTSGVLAGVLLPKRIVRRLMLFKIIASAEKLPTTAVVGICRARQLSSLPLALSTGDYGLLPIRIRR